MNSHRLLLLLVAILLTTAAWAQNADRGPRIGYCYPAGAKQGTTVEVTLGGQFLQNPSSVFLTGEGVHAEVILYGKPFNNMQLQELRQLLGPAMKKAPAAAQDVPVIAFVEPSTLPEHPLTRQICKMTVRELNYWVTNSLNQNRRQMNAQIGEMTVVQVTVDANAQPGDRELRLMTPGGLTNPLRFQVGTLDEDAEHEPNDIVPTNPEPLALPVTFNGQIMPGDVDRHLFHAQRGQRLTAVVQARHFAPYLADAVPGWFQPVVALRTADGEELAFADDFQGDPDPVLMHEIQADGDYVLEVRDSIYRGREDFVYRAFLGELPVITSVSPLGAQSGQKATLALTGWNLPLARLPIDTAPGDSIRLLMADPKLGPLLPARYGVDDLPQCGEKEPNDTIEQAYAVAPPRIINGAIDKVGDCDFFRVKGKAGDEIVADVMARRLKSPLDALLQICDATGKVLEWKDDCEDKSMGLDTHHADAFMRYKLPLDGDYFIRVSDAQHHGGSEYGYRLRISPPRPDFALRITPSVVNTGAGRTALVNVHAIRRDGFDGEIRVVLKDLSSGFVLQGGMIPAGRDSIRMTLTAPRTASDQPVPLDLEGTAKTATQYLVRPVIPAEDMQQAFIYQHLVPSSRLQATVLKRKGAIPPVAITNVLPVELPAGGSVVVHVRVPRKQVPKEVRFALDGAPDGIALERFEPETAGYALYIKAGSEAPKPGYADNLIVEAYMEVQPKAEAVPPKPKQRNSYGVLPAIPFVVTGQ